MPNNNDTRRLGDFCAYWEKLSELDKWLLFGRAVYMRYRRFRYIAAGALIALAVILGAGIFHVPFASSVMLLIGFLVGLLVAWN